MTKVDEIQLPVVVVKLTDFSLLKTFLNILWMPLQYCGHYPNFCGDLVQFISSALADNKAAGFPNWQVIGLQFVTDSIIFFAPGQTCVEFALQPQHETSLDSGMQLIEDFNYFKSKSRKRPKNLSMVSSNSNNWEKYWNTKVIPRNGLTSKRMKLEQCND